MADAYVEFVLRDFLANQFDSTMNDRVEYLDFEREQNVGELFGLNSEMIFGRLAYKKGDEIFRTDSLAVKQSNGKNNGAEFTSMQLANEIHFFTRVAPMLETSVSHHRAAKFEWCFPKFYNSCTIEAPACSRTVVIYENLRDRGYKNPSSKIICGKNIPASVFLDYSHLSLMMQKLGQFHGHSFAALKEGGTKFQIVADFVPRIQERFLNQYWGLGIVIMRLIRLVSSDPQYSNKVSASFIKKIENLQTILPFTNESKTMEVVCHGDYTATNVLFKYDQNGVPMDMKMLDLGLWRLASPAVDLAHVLYINADQETRDLYWSDLMEDYFKGVADILPCHQVPSRKLFLEGLKNSSPYVLAITSFFIPDQFARAKKTPTFLDLLTKNFPGNDGTKPVLSEEDVLKFCEENEVGGKEATEAVLNVIKDMINRNFI